jgi:uncharacterized protein DUF5682
MTVHVLGIRHHGPGSARAVAAELAGLKPDAVLIEGPADAGPVLSLAGAAGMRPPVALLAYAPDDPSRSAFWPFAVFSPEWQALTWALEHGVTVRFCDLPAANLFGGAKKKGAEPADEPDLIATLDEVDEEAPTEERRRAVRQDPLAQLSAAAGYDDPERWWDDVIESRLAGRGPFEAITEAMAELRSGAAEGPVREQQREMRREAYMRSTLRAVQAEGAERVAVVCGAWHAPALTGKLLSAAADAKVLRGLPKRKVALTWVPWTHSRLAASSGYGAGITSPGWYHHLFSHPEQTVVRWLTEVARTLRTEDLPVSSASVIEAVRLAVTLATLRGRHLPGLDEVTEATRAVLVDGDETMLALVTSRLVVGEALGEVPADTPTVPLDADLRATARSRRLKFEATERTLDVDLRKEGDRGKSQLLHRLRLLDIPWGVPAESEVRSTGTFRETWRLSWQPELAVNVIEGAMFGTTVESAATAKLRETAADDAATVPRLTAAVEAALLSDLPGALSPLLAALDDRAALDVDIEHLTGALPALVRAVRYGDVRGTDTTALTRVTDTMLTRICVGLPQAVTSLDDAGAESLRDGIDEVHAAVSLLDDESGRTRWLSAVAGIVDRADVHGLLVGRMVRLLRDAGRIDGPQAALRLSRALSVGATPAAKAAWVEGFLAGGGLLLVHDRELLRLIDVWVTGLGNDEFTDVLPLLRRTFGQFAVGERRSIAERVRRGDRAADPGAGSLLDEARAERALATVASILGVAR